MGSLCWFRRSFTYPKLIFPFFGICRIIKANSIERMLRMKKYLIGFIIGAMLMLSGTALAGTTIKNMVGSVIQGQFPVSVDNVVLGNPAIVIDGVSYLPVRQFAETIGYVVNFDPEGAINLEPDLSKISIIHGMSKEAKKWEDDMKEKTRLENLNNEDVNRIQSDLKLKTDQVKQAQDRIIRNEAKMKDSREFFEANKKPDDPTTYESRTIYTKFMELINVDKAEIIRLTAELEAKKAELLAQ